MKALNSIGIQVTREHCLLLAKHFDCLLDNSALNCQLLLEKLGPNATNIKVHSK